MIFHCKPLRALYRWYINANIIIIIIIITSLSGSMEAVQVARLAIHMYAPCMPYRSMSSFMVDNCPKTIMVIKDFAFVFISCLDV